MTFLGLGVLGCATAGEDALSTGEASGALVDDAVDQARSETELGALARKGQRVVHRSHCPEEEDPFEPNDTPEEAVTLPFNRIFNSPTWGGDAWIFRRLYLCNLNEDWFRIPASTLSFFPSPEYPIQNGFALELRLTAKGAGICQIEDCDDLILPPSRENTVAVEVYAAGTLQLLGTLTNPQGVIWLDSEGTHFTEDFLVRVHAPAPARFDYTLRVLLKNYDGEDECEC